MSERLPISDALDILRSMLPSWHGALVAYTESNPDAARAWDERVRRINLAIATAEDVRIHEYVVRALEQGRPVRIEASRMPREPALAVATVESIQRCKAWRTMNHEGEPASLFDVERCITAGIPALIADRIVAKALDDTRSTRACARVANGEAAILVLIGERGCGKSYAAADWLWNITHRIPSALQRKVTPRRFIEAPMLFEVPRDERVPKLGFARALVVDDAGTEHDAIVADWTGIFIQRYRNALPTIITTNLNESDFSERYGMRFADRMREVGRFVVVSNDETDSLRGR